MSSSTHVSGISPLRPSFHFRFRIHLSACCLSILSVSRLQHRSFESSKTLRSLQRKKVYRIAERRDSLSVLGLRFTASRTPLAVLPANRPPIPLSLFVTTVDPCLTLWETIFIFVCLFKKINFLSDISFSKKKKKNSNKEVQKVCCSSQKL